MTQKLDTAAKWLRESPTLLVTAGAGLTAAAGIDYGDRELFKKHFPAMLQYGFSRQLELIGFTRWSPDLQWGYWAAHVDLVRHRWPRTSVYATVARLIAERDSFVLTSNVDAMFVRHDVRADRVFTPQGDYAYLQCTTPCRQEVWTWKEQLDAIRSHTDRATQRLLDPELIPRCPNCGETVFPNVRVDHSFVDKPYQETGKALGKWLASRSEPGVVLEIGAGFNTPGVVRVPSERIVAARSNWRLIRLNMTDADVPNYLGERAVGIAGDATDTLDWIAPKTGNVNPERSHS